MLPPPRPSIQSEVAAPRGRQGSLRASLRSVLALAALDPGQPLGERQEGRGEPGGRHDPRAHRPLALGEVDEVGRPRFRAIEIRGQVWRSGGALQLLVDQADEDDRGGASAVAPLSPASSS
jgi:hypothetical protein